MRKLPDGTRQYRVAHQTLCITGFNFERQSLIGYVELLVYPLTPDLRRIKLNSKQCRIYRIVINDVWEAHFTYNDPTLEVCQGDVKQRNLDHFANSHHTAMLQVDADVGNGELCVRLPTEAAVVVQEMKPFRVCIEFSLEEPQGGLKFVVPDVDGTMLDRGAHLFTYGHENSSRLWFPCVDSFSEVCTWKLEFTVDMYMTAVSCGDLIETVYTTDLRKKTFHYYVSTPTSAPNIALAVGPFEVLVDRQMHEVTHFCLPHLMPLLRHATTFLHTVFEFYEEMMAARYPYSCYKQVFVDQAYDEASVYSTLSILSINLLHSKNIIDQVPHSRMVMAQAVAQQFFGCFIAMQSWCDAWLVKGITQFLAGLYKKKAFGNNAYKTDIAEALQEVEQYEATVGGIVLDPAVGKEPQTFFSTRHAHTVSPSYLLMYEKKAHLVMRMLEIAIGSELLLQAFNKLLSLAQNAASLKFNSGTWIHMLLSTPSFLKGLSTVTGKDVRTFIETWAHTSGACRFFGNFVFNRKRNVVELEIKQDMARPGTLKYVGPLTVTIQELDGTFKHTFKIEENKTKFEITCHSKSRRNKKKKIPLVTGEEVDMDLSAMDADSPVLWLRIDPDMTLLRQVTLEQPDYMWQYMVRYERDVVAQTEAVAALYSYPSPATRKALTDVIETETTFYRVRIGAAHCLAKVANLMVAGWAGPPAMMTIFRKLFGSHSCPEIVRQNNFSNFQHYHLQKAVPVAMSQLRTVHGICPGEVLKFILDLFKYNDNTRNKYADNYYKAALVTALAGTVTPAITPVTVTGFGPSTDNLTADTRLILEEISRYLNMEKLLPCYRLTITVSCLRALRRLQRFGHLPPDATVFKSYAASGNFLDVRVAALEALVDYTKVDTSPETLSWLLNFLEMDTDSYVKHRLLQLLITSPPFTRHDVMTSHDVTTSALSTDELVERLWRLMNTTFAHDSRLRCDVADLYHALYGRQRPDCLPIPESVMLLNLRHKTTKMRPGREDELLDVGGPERSVLKRRLSPSPPPREGEAHYQMIPLGGTTPDDDDSQRRAKIKFESGSAMNPITDLSEVDILKPGSGPNTVVAHQEIVIGGESPPYSGAPHVPGAPFAPGGRQESRSRLSEDSNSGLDTYPSSLLGPTSFSASMFQGGPPGGAADSPAPGGAIETDATRLMQKLKKKKKKKDKKHKHKKRERPEGGLGGRPLAFEPSLSSDTSNANSPMLLENAPSSPEFEII